MGAPRPSCGACDNGGGGTLQHVRSQKEVGSPAPPRVCPGDEGATKSRGLSRARAHFEKCHRDDCGTRALCRVSTFPPLITLCISPFS